MKLTIKETGIHIMSNTKDDTSLLEAIYHLLDGRLEGYNMTLTHSIPADSLFLDKPITPKEFLHGDLDIWSS